MAAAVHLALLVAEATQGVAAGAAELRLLDLSECPLVGGNVASLARLVELRYINLHGCPLVVGEAAALAALVHLGEEYTLPGCGGSCDNGRLYLSGSGVHVPVAALRALPGLGADWGSHSDEFTPCSAFGGQQASSDNDYTWGTGSPGCGAAGLAPVAVSTLSTPALRLLCSEMPAAGLGGYRWIGRVHLLCG